jgi:hypothetical protein
VKIIVSGILACLLRGCAKENYDEPKVESSVSIDLTGEKKALEKNLKQAERELKAGAEVAKEKIQETGAAIRQEAQEIRDRVVEDDKDAEVKGEVRKD